MLSVEEVLRLHCSKNSAKTDTLDADLRRLKASHIKLRADEALKQGNLREAWTRYSEAIELQLDREASRLLHSNRSLAYLRARRFEDALKDADKAVELGPKWVKGHWRKGAALLGLKRTPAAVLAYRDAWSLDRGDAELESKLWAAVQRLTREELARAILALVGELQEQGEVLPPRKESVTQQELREGCFSLIKKAHHCKPQPGMYYGRYLEWLKRGMSKEVGYMVRAAVHSQAKCYLQARADALAGVEALLLRLQESGSWRESDSLKLLSEAYRCLGDACMAEAGHEDRDCSAAAKAYAKAADIDSDDEEAREGLKQAGEELTKEQLEEISLEVYNEGALGGSEGARPRSTLGFLERPLQGERAFRVDLRLLFPEAKASQLNARAREALRLHLADHLALDPLRLSIERVFAPTAAHPGLRLTLHVHVGVDLAKAAKLTAAAKDSARLQAAVGGGDLIPLLGPLGIQGCSAEVVDITPTCASGQGEAGPLGGEAQQAQHGGGGDPEEMQMVVPPRPKLELELPYKQYRLVRGDGSVVERADKHPFCMSRVYYSSEEKPEEVWTELADASCRWRQTGSEIKIMVLRVPQEVPAKQLDVTIEPLYLKVCNKISGEMYLEGDLERAVIPEDCFWTHCQGKNDDGCMVFLRKMNLELLQRHWMHNEMWWPRLFKHHGEIAWDDYEKDYSDLPEEVLHRHRVTEAIKDSEKQIEHTEKTKREILQERDDCRKRARQERLNELRTGTRKTWVQLHRENPA